MASLVLQLHLINTGILLGNLQFEEKGSLVVLELALNHLPPQIRRQITDKQRNSNKGKAFDAPKMLQALLNINMNKERHGRGRERLSATTYGGKALCPDFFSWRCGNVLCRCLFSFFFVLFLLLNNTLQIRQTLDKPVSASSVSSSNDSNPLLLMFRQLS